MACLVSSFLVADDLSAVSVKLERLLDVKIGNICDALMSQLLPTLQEIITMDYQLDEHTYEQMTETETWPHRILSQACHFFSALESVMTSENHSQVQFLSKSN